MVDENGTLFSCPPGKGTRATIFYRPHETWTTRADWRTQLPKGEDVTGKQKQLRWRIILIISKLYHSVTPTWLSLHPLITYEFTLYTVLLLKFIDKNLPPQLHVYPGETMF